MLKRKTRIQRLYDKCKKVRESRNFRIREEEILMSTPPTSTPADLEASSAGTSTAVYVAINSIKKHLMSIIFVVLHVYMMSHE